MPSFTTSSLPMPKALHEAFGERQQPLHLAFILGFGGAVCAFAFSLYPETFAEISFWKSVLALVILFDIAAGCVANFTPGTNSYYATRPGHRWAFIAMHVHLPLFALLLGEPIAATLALWFYTIMVASVVNLQRNSGNQRVVAATLVLVGLLVVLFGGVFTPLVALTGMLFLIKVAYAFAVDHQGATIGSASAQRL